MAYAPTVLSEARELRKTGTCRLKSVHRAELLTKLQPAAAADASK